MHPKSAIKYIGMEVSTTLAQTTHSYAIMHGIDPINMMSTGAKVIGTRLTQCIKEHMYNYTDVGEVIHKVYTELYAEIISEYKV